jgi:predicted O-methyltransferase YrrM
MNSSIAGPKPQLMTDLGIAGCFSWENEAAFLADALQIVQPKSILETGFFAGASAFMNLYLSDACVTSVDPMENLYDPSVKHDGNLGNVDKLKVAFPGRFTFLRKDSKVVRPDLVGQNFDLMFIDGDHWEIGARNDFQLAIDLNIPWILVDDFVTSVAEVYAKEFQHEFFPVRIYPRKDQFMGKPIPIVLLKRFNHKVSARLNGANAR